MSDIVKLQIQVETNALLEAGYLADEGGIHPDWIYAARRNRLVAEGKAEWLGELLKALEWQGGTIHQALSCVARIVQAEKDREKSRKN